MNNIRHSIIKTINSIVIIWLNMAVMSCIPDKATYTNVEESIFVTTERIDVDKYRIYLSKDVNIKESHNDFLDLSYMPSDFPPEVFINTKLYYPDTIYVYDPNGRIIDFRESNYKINVVGTVESIINPYSSSKFDRKKYSKEDNRSFPFLTDSTGLRSGQRYVCTFDLNPWMDGIKLLYEEDGVPEGMQAIRINKVYRTGWENHDKILSNGIENKYCLNKEKLCIKSHRDNDKLIITLGYGSESYNDWIELSIKDRYDIDLYYLPPDTIYIDKGMNVGEVNFKSDRLKIINLEYWPYEFKPVQANDDTILKTFYRLYRHHVDYELLKDKYYYRIRDFGNMDNGMSVKKFYNGLVSSE